MKIIGNTVGMGLPKPNLMQTDPSKGDYVKGKEEIRKKLDADKLPEAISTALAQAKASGEFDGDPGKDYVITPDDYAEIAEIAAGMVEVPEAPEVSMKPLTFTGAVNATYDGSQTVEVEIPQGGGGSGGSTTKQMRLIHSVDVASGETLPKITITKDTDGNSFSLQQIAIVVSNVTTNNYMTVAFTQDQWAAALKAWPAVTKGSFTIEVERLGNRVTRAYCITGEETLKLYKLKTNYTKDITSITGIIITLYGTADDGANVSVYGC